jgi:hypothetical protein
MTNVNRISCCRKGKHRFKHTVPSEYIQFRFLSSCNNIKTFDFSILYATIPHSKLCFIKKLRFLVLRLKSSLPKHYRCPHNLVSRYWLYVPHMTTDCVSLSHYVTLISYFMAHYLIYIKTNTTGATWKAGQYQLPEFPLVFCGVCIAQSLVFGVGGADHYPFRLDNVLFALCQLTCFADHVRVFKLSVVMLVLLDLWSSL